MIAGVTRATSKKEAINVLIRANSCKNANCGLFQHLTEDNTNQYSIINWKLVIPSVDCNQLGLSYFMYQFFIFLNLGFAFTKNPVLGLKNIVTTVHNLLRGLLLFSVQMGLN